ncbi:MAG TPA: AMP-binding protein [Nocardioidaceae bacterium]
MLDLAAAPEAPDGPTERQPTAERSRLVAHLAGFGERTALISAGGSLTYSELASRVEALAVQIGTERRLVLLEAANSVASIVGLLAAWSGRHPVILTAPDRLAASQSLRSAYAPDVVVTDGADLDGDPVVTHLRTTPGHQLHPDLALLVSTSGSTGSPKLVRLSHRNLLSNAEAIASYLEITPDDRAAMTLPIHYCYGLSVVTSHLLRGSSLVVSDLSVVDRCFWDLFRAAGCTSFAGVPYTFELLDRCGFADLDLPTLRYVTQAGGRLDAATVRRYAGMGRDRGWDLVVMYGQAEATARMAYLPPDRTLDQPEAVGIPIPGGDLRLEPVADTEPDVGELVYSGPNVMMGYARGPSDLALGACVRELHTGDLARRTPDGLYQIVGRRNRFAKLYGHRIDLDQVERLMAANGVAARCVAVDSVLCAFVTSHRRIRKARDLVAHLTGLPPTATRAAYVQEQPRTANGKVDYHALADYLPTMTDTRSGGGSGSLRDEAARRDGLRNLYAELLGRPDADDHSSFVSLGGDSLSYVEVSIRLGELLPVLPPDWPDRTVAELAADPTPARRGTTVESSVLLRALAIVAIVGTHANLFTYSGGAHLLLAVAGYSFARFQLGNTDRRVRLRRGLAAVAHVAVPSGLIIAGTAAVTGAYTWPTAMFLNGLLGSDSWTDQWRFWFLECLVWTLLACVVVLAIPALHRTERRRPWGFAIVVLAGGIAVRYLLVGVEAGPTQRYTPSIVFGFFALGWAAQRASSTYQKAVVSAAALVCTLGFFGDLRREGLIVAGVVALVWLPSVRAPAPLARLLGVVAASSLMIYLTHWQVYPYLEDSHSFTALVLSVLVGVGCKYATDPLLRWVPRLSNRVIEVATTRIRPGVSPTKPATSP